MKVLLLHNFYQSSSPSGEDVVYQSEVKLLKSKGIDVVLYEKSNDEISVYAKWQAVIGAVWSRKTYDEVSVLIRREKPDIAHVHNIWYLISPSAYYACKDAGIPVVQTLHNFRMFCVNGLMMRSGQPCEECVGKAPWRSVAYGCYQNSRMYSFPVAFSEWFHKLKNTWTDNVAAYITLTEFGKKKFIECGLPESKIYVKPNFLAGPLNVSASPQPYAVFIGRLSQEKGIDVLVDAFQILSSSYPLLCKIVGGGPLMPRVKGEGQRAEGHRGIHIEFTGRKNHDECMEILKGSLFLILPSVCYENFPLTIVEAFAFGKPVITSNHGAMAAVVEHRKTGLLFEPGDSADLAEKIRWMTENRDACIEMGKNARAEFEANYAEDRNFEILLGIYEKVLAQG